MDEHLDQSMPDAMPEGLANDNQVESIRKAIDSGVCQILDELQHLSRKLDTGGEVTSISRITHEQRGHSWDHNPEPATGRDGRRRPLVNLAWSFAQPEQPDKALKQLKNSQNRALMDIEEKHKRELDYADQDCKKFQRQLKDSERRLHEIGETNTQLQIMNTKLESQASNFRDIIIKRANNETDSISDGSIRESFVDLGAQIQAIFRKFYKLSAAPKGKMKEHDSLSILWKSKMPDAQIKNRARGLMFDIVYSEVLTRLCFGVDALDHGDIEHGLAKFEETLHTVKGNHEEEIADWRTRTMQCARLLATSNRQSKLEILLHDFMDPLLATDLDKTSKKTRDQDLKERVRKLCGDAVKFRLLLRSFKDLYECEIPGPTLSFDEAEPQDSERKDGNMEEGAKIAYTLFGSLVKYPLYEPRERRVLQKAQVVVGD